MPRSISARTVSRQPQLIVLLQLRSSRPLGPLLCDGATRMTGLWSGEALFVSARCRLCHSRLRRGLSAGLCSRATRPRPRTTCAAQEPLRQLENRDLVVGDVAALWAFSCCERWDAGADWKGRSGRRLRRFAGASSAPLNPARREADSGHRDGPIVSGLARAAARESAAHRRVHLLLGQQHPHVVLRLAAPRRIPPGRD